MLELKGVSVAYGPVTALRGISLKMEEGDSVAMLGPNGAGKTSMLRAISGLIPYQGTIHYQGRELRDLSPGGIARRGLIHVPEGRHVFPSLTVRENLQIGRQAAGKRRAWSLESIVELFPPLEKLIKRRGWQLSGGEQQMVALGRALMAAPLLLLLDEPSLGLAPILVDKVYEALATISTQIPVLLVEQNTTVALDLCERAFVLADGEIRLEGSSDSISDRTGLIDSYLGRGSRT